MEDLAFWQTLISGAAGGVLALVGQGLTGWMTAKREATARIDLRRATLGDRRDEFELEQLALLRSEVVEYADANATLAALLRRAAAEHDDPELAWDSPDADAHSAAERRLLASREVTLSEQVRRAIDLLVEQGRENLRENRPTRGHLGMWTARSAALAVAGERVRTLYGREAEG